MACFYAGTVFLYTENFPFWDDYYALLDFVALAKTNPSWAQRWSALFEQHYEHRIATARLVAWAWYAATGSVNFRGLVAIANLFYFTWFAWFAWLGFKRWQLSPWLLLTIACFVFSINHWEVSSWATTGLFFFTIDLFSLAAITWYFSEPKTRLVPAVIAAAIATFSGAHGMLVFPAVAVIAFLRGEWKSRKWFWWVAAFLLVAACYLWNYQRPAHQQPIIRVLLSQPTMALRYFLVFTGNVFNHGKNLALGWGLFSLLLFAWVVYRKVWQRYAQLSAMLLFLLLTIVVTTAGRSAVGAGQAFTLRYIAVSGLYSALLLVLAVLAMPAKWKKKSEIVALAMAIAGFVFSYVQMLPVIQHVHQQFVVDKQRVQQGRLSYFAYGSDFDNKQSAKDWLRTYDSLGLFPFKYYADEEKIMQAIPEAASSIWKPGLVTCKQESNYWHVQASFTKLQNDSIHYVAMMMNDSTGKPSWFAMMRLALKKNEPGEQRFNVIIWKQDWPRRPAVLHFQLTDEKQRSEMVYRIDTTGICERFDPLKDQ